MLKKTISIPFTNLKSVTQEEMFLFCVKYQQDQKGKLLRLKTMTAGGMVGTVDCVFKNYVANPNAPTEYRKSLSFSKKDSVKSMNGTEKKKKKAMTISSPKPSDGSPRLSKQVKPLTESGPSSPRKPVPAPPQMSPPQISPPPQMSPPNHLGSLSPRLAPPSGPKLAPPPPTDSYTGNDSDEDEDDDSDYDDSDD